MMQALGVPELIIILAIVCSCVLVVAGAGVGVYFLLRRDGQGKADGE